MSQQRIIKPGTKLFGARIWAEWNMSRRPQFTLYTYMGTDGVSYFFLPYKRTPAAIMEIYAAFIGTPHFRPFLIEGGPHCAPTA